MPDPVDDDGRLEDAEGRRDDLGFDLTEDRPAAREVRGPVGHRDVAELPGARREPELLVRAVTFRREVDLSHEGLEPGREGPGADAELSVVDHGRNVASPAPVAPWCVVPADRGRPSGPASTTLLATTQEGMNPQVHRLSPTSKGS